MGEIVKVVSIRQPWANFVAHGIKDIENRTWATKYRGPIYIHASSKFVGNLNTIFSDEQWESMGEVNRCNMVIKDFPTGAIIGKVDIVDCVINHPSIWAEKTAVDICPDTGVSIIRRGQKTIWNWVLENAVLFDEPILNIKGKLSLWDFQLIT